MAAAAVHVSAPLSAPEGAREDLQEGMAAAAAAAQVSSSSPMQSAPDGARDTLFGSLHIDWLRASISAIHGSGLPARVFRQVIWQVLEVSKGGIPGSSGGHLAGGFGGGCGQKLGEGEMLRTTLERSLRLVCRAAGQELTLPQVLQWLRSRGCEGQSIAKRVQKLSKSRNIMTHKDTVSLLEDLCLFLDVWDEFGADPVYMQSGGKGSGAAPVHHVIATPAPSTVDPFDDHMDEIDAKLALHESGGHEGVFEESGASGSDITSHNGDNSSEQAVECTTTKKQETHITSQSRSSTSSAPTGRGRGAFPTPPAEHIEVLAAMEHEHNDQEFWQNAVQEEMATISASLSGMASEQGQQQQCIDVEAASTQSAAESQRDFQLDMPAIEALLADGRSLPEAMEQVRGVHPQVQQPTNKKQPRNPQHHEQVQKPFKGKAKFAHKPQKAKPKAKAGVASTFSQSAS